MSKPVCLVMGAGAGFKEHFAPRTIKTKAPDARGKADAVEIKNGKVSQSQGFNIHVRGLETLKSVNATAKNGVSNAHVWTPTMYSDDLSRDRYHKLLESNQAYDNAIDKMESSLRSIKDMTSNAGDATSRAIHIQAKTYSNCTSLNTV